MVDHHVDRPEVEASQGVELTGTNRSEILTKLKINARVVALEVLLYTAFEEANFPARSAGAPARHRDGDQVSGVHSGGVPPVPIPNTAVKPASADDSRTAGSLESRSVPDLITKKLVTHQHCGELLFNSTGSQRSLDTPEAIVPS